MPHPPLQGVEKVAFSSCVMIHQLLILWLSRCIVRVLAVVPWLYMYV